MAGYDVRRLPPCISKCHAFGKDFELVIDPERCTGCGFCDGVCPCGIWQLVENDPLWSRDEDGDRTASQRLLSDDCEGVSIRTRWL
jgi:Fe-S-cluster-containing hydrogenase component 2